MSYMPIFVTIVRSYDDQSSNYQCALRHDNKIKDETNDKLSGINKDELLRFIEKKRKFDDRMKGKKELT